MFVVTGRHHLAFGWHRFNDVHILWHVVRLRLADAHTAFNAIHPKHSLGFAQMIKTHQIPKALARQHSVGVNAASFSFI